MIIITHIPKTGGTSLRQYLQGVFGTDLFEDYAKLRQARTPWWRRLLGLTYGELGRVPPGTRCIIGHGRANKYDAVLPHARHAIWLRDPVERLVSHYYHFLRRPDECHAQLRRVFSQHVTLQQFVELPILRNRQSQLACKPLEAFEFVGITEHYEISLQLFARVFDLPAPAAVPCANRNSERRDRRYALDPALRETIRRLNTADDALYQAGRQRFAHLLRQHRMPVQRLDAFAA